MRARMGPNPSPRAEVQLPYCDLEGETKGKSEHQEEERPQSEVPPLGPGPRPLVVHGEEEPPDGPEGTSQPA